MTQQPEGRDPICTDGIERLRIRVYEPREAGARTLVYLPGLHGDWTLIGALRLALEGRVRFVEMTYPRDGTWMLTDYAKAIEDALRAHGIEKGWLLGESFGSQVLWALVERSRFECQGIILAGGFIKYPIPWLLGVASWLGGRVSNATLRRALSAYLGYAKLRFSHSREAMQGALEFVERRTEADQRVMHHRLGLIRQSDPRAVVRSTRIPVHHLHGGLDPVVPWPWVKGWLRQHCATLRGSRCIPMSDHTVLTTASQASAEQICQWMA